MKASLEVIVKKYSTAKYLEQGSHKCNSKNP